MSEISKFIHQNVNPLEVCLHHEGEAKKKLVAKLVAEYQKANPREFQIRDGEQFVAPGFGELEEMVRALAKDIAHQLQQYRGLMMSRTDHGGLKVSEWMVAATSKIHEGLSKKLDEIRLPRPLKMDEALKERIKKIDKPLRRAMKAIAELQIEGPHTGSLAARYENWRQEAIDHAREVIDERIKELSLQRRKFAAIPDFEERAIEEEQLAEAGVHSIRHRGNKLTSKDYRRQQHNRGELFNSPLIHYM